MLNIMNNYKNANAHQKNLIAMEFSVLSVKSHIFGMRVHMHVKYVLEIKSIIIKSVKIVQTIYQLKSIINAHHALIILLMIQKRRFV